MPHMINITIEEDGLTGFVASTGLSQELALRAVQAVERELQRRVVRAELEAEAAKEQPDGA